MGVAARACKSFIVSHIEGSGTVISSLLGVFLSGNSHHAAGITSTPPGREALFRYGPAPVEIKKGGALLHDPRWCIIITESL